MTPPAKPTAPQSLAGIPVARTVGELRREIMKKFHGVSPAELEKALAVRAESPK